MKIAHVGMFYYPTFGGVEQVMQELAERQVKAGHEVHVFCSDSDKYKRIKKKEEVINGVYVHRHKYILRLSLSALIWPSLLSTLSKQKFDVIHSHVSGHLHVLLAGIVARKTKTPHIHTTHCPWTDKYRSFILKPFLFLNDKLFNKMAFDRCDKIIAITPWEIPILKKWVDEKKIVVIPNGMDNLFFKKLKENKFKEKNNIPKDKKIILFFGRLNPTKGPEKLALVARELVKERKDLNFVFIGPDEGKAEEVKEIIKDQERMFYFGPIQGKENIAEMYQASDVFVMPSYREGLPLCLFEAMASGLPVIASPVNGIPFEMKDNENGFFVNYGDIGSLKEKILKVIDNPKLSEKFSKNNKEKSKNYTWDIIEKKYMEVYKNA